MNTQPNNKIIHRNNALRFVAGTEGLAVVAKLNAWNEIFAKLPGDGYYDFSPVYETVNGVNVESYYMKSDSTFWKGFIEGFVSISELVENVVMESGVPELERVHAHA